MQKAMVDRELLIEAAEAFASIGMFESVERCKAALEASGPVTAWQWRIKGASTWAVSNCKVEADARLRDERFEVVELGPACGATITLGPKPLGSYGSLYDSPSIRRAYTYQHQPGNEAAHRIGVAAQATGIGGDAIDKGLKLLCELERAGYGVFAV